MSKKVGYALHQIGEGSVISNSIICNLSPNQKPFFVYAKRKDLIFCEIVEKGINPLYKVPFTKVIVSLRIFTAKSLGKQTGSDLIIVFFHDCSFLAFSDPKHIKYQYHLLETKEVSNYICEAHDKNPILFTLNKIGLLSFWNLIDKPNRVYNIQYTGQHIIDLKFLQHQTIRLAYITDTGAGSRSVKVCTFNSKFLILEEVSKLCINQLLDSTSSIIVPFPHGDHEKPVYLVLGTENIALVFKTGVVNVDSPFEGYSPRCFCELGGWSSLVATTDGSLFGMYFETQFEFFKIGKVPILPTTITKIDGNIFFIGSSYGDSLFAQISNDSIQILQKITQFTPVNSISPFCENAGSVFLTQGNDQTSYISELKTGTVFTAKVEIPILYVESIFSACGVYLILSLFNDTSACIECKNYEIVTLENFLSDCKTTNTLPRSDDSFFQVTSRAIRAVGTGSCQAEISYENDIVFSTTDGNNILLLFSNSVEVMTMNLDPVSHINFENSQAITAALHQEKIAVSFYSNEIRILSEIEVINSVKIIDEELIAFIQFVECKDTTVLFTFSLNGTIIQFNFPNLQEIGHIQLGYQIKNIFKINASHRHQELNDALFINGTSPVFFYPDGSFSSVICESHLASCSIKDTLFAMVADSKLLIGKMDNSSICSITPKECGPRPLLFSIHKDPFSLFVSFEKGMKFTVSTFLLPSFSQTFSHELQEFEELTCFYYHEELKATFFGTALNSPRTPLKGVLFAVKELFNEFAIVCNEEIDGNIFTINSSKPNNLIIGSTSKLIINSVSALFNGTLKVEPIKIIGTQVIPRSVSILTNKKDQSSFIVYFGAERAITVLKENKDGSISDDTEEIIINTRIHSGFVGKPLTSNSCHAFTIENEKILTVYLLKFEDDSISSKILTTFELESPVSYFQHVRDGFALISTKNGSLYALQQYSRDHVLLLKKISDEIAKIFPFTCKNTKILDASILDIFEDLPQQIQTEIAASVDKKPNEIKIFIKSLLHALSLMCSNQ